MSDLFIALWLQNKLLNLFIKEICQTFLHKNWNKMPQKKRLESFYIFELVTQHFKQRKQALVLFANDSVKKGINNK